QHPRRGRAQRPRVWLVQLRHWHRGTPVEPPLRRHLRPLRRPCRVRLGRRARPRCQRALGRLPAGVRYRRHKLTPPSNFAAIKPLAANPAAALDLLARELAPLPDDPAPRVRELVAQLRAPRYVLRETAQQQLAVLGPLAEPELRRLLAAGLNLEAKTRVEQL